MNNLEERTQDVIAINNVVYNLLGITSDVVSLPDMAYYDTIIAKFKGIRRYMDLEISRLEDAKEVFDESAESEG